MSTQEKSGAPNRVSRPFRCRIQLCQIHQSRDFVDLLCLFLGVTFLCWFPNTLKGSILDWVLGSFVWSYSFWFLFYLIMEFNLGYLKSIILIVYVVLYTIYVVYVKWGHRLPHLVFISLPCTTKVFSNLF